MESLHLKFLAAPPSELEAFQVCLVLGLGSISLFTELIRQLWGRGVALIDPPSCSGLNDIQCLVFLWPNANNIAFNLSCASVVLLRGYLRA